jgi:hypothetical protein
VKSPENKGVLPMSHLAANLEWFSEGINDFGGEVIKG